MAPLKQKGDVAELAVALDLRRRGYKVAIPFGEDCDYDLVLDRGDSLERIQVKYATSDGAVIPVRCRSHSLTSGKVKSTKYYTAETIDWLAIYEPTSDCCYYLPAEILGDGRAELRLRLTPARNNQLLGIRMAADFLEL
jgi:hypothetical protein